MQGSLQGIAIVLLDAQERVVERFVVQVRAVPPTGADVPWRWCLHIRAPEPRPRQVASLVSRDEAGGEGLDHVIAQVRAAAAAVGRGAPAA